MELGRLSAADERRVEAIGGSVQLEEETSNVVCRVWRGWTSADHAESYDDYPQKELFPRLSRELQSHGYRGYQLLRLSRGEEVEFMTMLWFESIEKVGSFAGENYETPVISEEARSLLTRFADHADDYQLSGSNLFDASNRG
jgi:hypothetical protein